MPAPIDIAPAHLEIVRDILKAHVPNDVRVWVFGSRAAWTAKEFSDLDLALEGAGPMGAEIMLDLAAAFEESALPWKVDVLDMHRLAPGFRATVEKQRVPMDDILRFNEAATLVQVSASRANDVKSLAKAIGGEKRVIGGPFGSKLTQRDYVREGIPVIRGSNMQHEGRWIGGEFAFVSQEKYLRELKSNAVRPGDIIVTQRGTLGQVSIVPENGGFPDYVVSQSQMAVRVNEREASRDFVYYFLTSPAFDTYVEKATIQTGVPHINLGILRDVQVSWPDISTQNAIACLLSSFDDKIELNRRMNETLEAMAQAIFKDWFVDFGPTRRQMQGATDPAAIMGHAFPPEKAATLAPLFPATLNDDELPKGWKMFTLADLAHHHRAIVSPSTVIEQTFEHYSIPAYDNGNEPTLDLGASIKSNKTIVPEDAVLLSKLNPEIERVWLPNPKSEWPQVSSTEFLAFTPLEGATRAVLFCMFKSEAFRAEMAAMVTGTSKSHQRVSPKSLLTREVLTAAPQLLHAFDGMARPFLNRLLANRSEAHTLAQTRDLLLPKLMSGEIRLAEAEKAVEAVA